MDAERFDRLAKTLAGTGTRRRTLGFLLSAALAVPAGLRPDPAAAARRQWSERRIIEIIEDAARRYDQPRAAMLRVARCESGLDPYAKNPDGPYYGLFQFLPSTWRSTPYANESWYDPKANARAAGWMWREGRRNEWACQ